MLYDIDIFNIVCLGESRRLGGFFEGRIGLRPVIRPYIDGFFEGRIGLRPVIRPYMDRGGWADTPAALIRPYRWNCVFGVGANKTPTALFVRRPKGVKVGANNRPNGPIRPEHMTGIIIMKLLLAVTLIAILTALGFGLYYLYKDSGERTRTLRSLIIRVTLAILLIALLIIAVWMGWIHPHPVGR